MPAERPTKTGIHNLLDIEVANSLDFHIASTNFISVVNDYADYIALNYIWSETKHTNDPITQQVLVFKNLNDSTYNLQDQHHRAGNQQQKTLGIKTAMEQYVNYDIIDLNSYLEENEIWVKTVTNLPEQFVDASSNRVFFKALNLETDLERVVEYIPPLATTYTILEAFLRDGEQWLKDESGFPAESDGTYTAVDVSGQRRPVSPPAPQYPLLKDVIKEKLAALKSKFGCNEMTDEFLLVWYEKYKSAHYLVKQEYKKIIGDDFTKNYFEDFNDSIGVLGRLFEYPDGICIPLTDITLDQNPNGRLVIPRTIPPNIFDKLDTQTQRVMLESSATVNSLFRLNIVHAIDEIATPSTSHGTNLVTDYLHYNRVSSMFSSIAGIISDTLGVSYRILGFATTAENKQQAISPKLTNIIENHKVQVDCLNRKVNNLEKVITSQDVLDASDIDNQFQG